MDGQDLAKYGVIKGKSDIEYDVVKEDSLSELIDEVRVFIEKGWKPLGGMTIQSDEHFINFYQTIIREKQRYWIFDGEEFVESECIDREYLEELLEMN